MHDFMTLVFSCDKFNEFLMWGFWVGAHWLPNVAMFATNWMAKPNVLTYTNLVFNQWWTRHMHLETDARGCVEVLAFKGQLVVELMLANSTLVQSHEINTSVAQSLSVDALWLPWAVALPDDNMSSASGLMMVMAGTVHSALVMLL
jgi:hypothetical protein